ncbi:MAG: AAA family ATPase [Anaerolineae bacterium]
MKNLVIINGTMGVGKTATSRALARLLPRAAFLDGDWCWTYRPDAVNDETKALVMDNITHMLGNYLQCSAYDNIVFCWVADSDAIIGQILAPLQGLAFNLHKLTITCSEETLRRRLAPVRTPEAIASSVSRLQRFTGMATVKIDNEGLTVLETAEEIARLVLAGS